MDRRLYSTQLQSSSKRSLISESESDVVSLLSGLSQAREIPDRRRRIPGDNATNGNNNSNKLPRNTASSRRAKENNGLRTISNNNKTRGFSSRRELPDQDALSKLKQKNESYKRHSKQIILMQAFARGYIVRFAFRSRLTMERTKRRFFAVLLQANIRGFLERQRYTKLTGKKTERLQKPQTREVDVAVRTPSQNNRRQRKSRTDQEQPFNPTSRTAVTTKTATTITPKKPAITVHLESDSDRSEVSLRLVRLMSHRPPIQTADKLGDSASELGSIRSVMSSLSVARKVPDRRRRQEQKETDAVKRIQALARGYIQRFLYKSILAMEKTKKEYASITIQACARGYLQRKKGPSVSRKHVSTRSEGMQSSKGEESRPIPDKQLNNRKPKKLVESTDIPTSIIQNRSRRMDSKIMRKPVRHRSGDELLPRQLTIRKPREQTRNTEEERHHLPVKHLTIRQPRRHLSNSDGDGSHESPPKRVTLRPRNFGRGDRDQHTIDNEGNLQRSPPRKVMLRGGRKQQESDTDKSEDSLQPEKILQSRRDKLMSLSKASERFGESESDVGSLMSGLSQARKVPDRRQRNDLGMHKNKRRESDTDKSEEFAEPRKASRRGGDKLMSHSRASERFAESESDVGSLMSGLSQARKVPDRRQKDDARGPKKAKRSNPSSTSRSGKQEVRIKSVVKIQALGRGYNARFSFKSRLIMEQTKQRFFAIQIQALLRGFLVRSRISK